MGIGREVTLLSAHQFDFFCKIEWIALLINQLLLRSTTVLSSTLPVASSGPIY